MSGGAEEPAVRDRGAGCIQNDVSGGRRGVGDLDPTVDDRPRDEAINDVQLRSRIVAFGDRDVDESEPDPVGWCRSSGRAGYCRWCCHNDGHGDAKNESCEPSEAMRCHVLRGWAYPARLPNRTDG